MPAWILISVAGCGLMGVLAIVVTLAPKYEGQHVLPDPQEEWDAWMAENERGSMILAEEHPLEPLPAPVVDAEPWRQQITEELSPEALGMCEHGWPGDTCGQAHPYMAAPTPVHDHTVDEHGELLHACRACLADAGLWDEREEIVLPAYGGWVSGPCLDPGPGDAAVDPPAAPGPDQLPNRGDDQGRDGGCAPQDSRPAARADLTGSLSPRSPKEDPGSPAHGEPGPSPWLEGQMAILFDWVREQHARGALA